MKTKKSRVVLSSVSVLLVLSLLAGMTMAWFTDTEKVNANFTAGVLDISVKPGETDKGDLTFENLRPMLYDNFYKELEPNGNEKWVNDVTQDNTTGLDDEDYAPVPAYFKPVVIKNEGTLPAKVKLSLEAGDGCEAGEPILTENNITIKQDPEKMQDCANRLAPVLKVFVYKLVGETWTKVEDVNLNTAYDEAKANPDKVASDNTAKETNNTYMTAMLPAQGTATYVIAGYLPETVNNAYQGQHFHGKLVLNAYQMDDTGAGKPDEGGSSSTDPEDPDRFEDNVTIEWREGTAEGDLVQSQNETVKSNTTIAAVNYDAPEGYVYSPEAAEQKTDVVVDEKTGEATPGKVIFTVVPEEAKNVEITVKYEATFDTEDETDDREVKTATISLAAPGEYTLVTGNTAQGRVARNNGNEPKEITIPAPPAGFAYDPAGQTVSVQVDAEGNVTPEEIIFKVRSEEANVVIRYVDQALVGNDAIVDSYTDTVEATIGQKYTYSTDTPVVKDHLPEGYEFPTPGVSVKITYLDDFKDEDNTVDGKRVAYVSFVVKKAEGGDPSKDYDYSVTVQYKEGDSIRHTETVPFTVKGDVTSYTINADLSWVKKYDNDYDSQTGQTQSRYMLASGQSGSQSVTLDPVAGTATPNPVVFELQTGLYKSGEGSPENPYVVSSAVQFDNIRWSINSHFVLGDSINLGNNENRGYFSTIGLGVTDTPFTGSLDGNGHTISNLKIDYGTEYGWIGLFAANEGEIKNLVIEDPYSSGASTVGVVAGLNKGLIENCHVVNGGTVEGLGRSTVQTSGRIGGITGENQGTVRNCSSSVEAVGYINVGGLVGINFGTIEGCYSTGGVNSASSTATSSQLAVQYVGGLVGSNQRGATIENCYNNTSQNVAGYSGVGGFIGYNAGTVKNCYSRSTGSVSSNSNGIAHRCIGAIDAAAGANPIATNVYYESNFTTSNRNKGINKTAAQLQSGTLTGIQGNNAWVCESGSYPKLAWEVA